MFIADQRASKSILKIFEYELVANFLWMPDVTLTARARLFCDDLLSICARRVLRTNDWIMNRIVSHAHLTRFCPLLVV